MGMMQSEAKVFRWIAWAMLAVSAMACTGGLNVKSVRHDAQSPSQVAVLLSVASEQSSIEALEASSFQLTENGTLLDPSETRLRLLDRDVAAVHHTLVLIDLGGPAMKTTDRELLVEQLAPFVDQVRTQQAVTVAGFDAEQRIFPIGRFAKRKSGGSSSLKQLKKLTRHPQKDTASDLHGAIVLALEDLQAQLAKDKRPVGVGNLVVILRTSNFSGKTDEDEMYEALDTSPQKVYAVTIGAEDAREHGELIGRDGAFNSDGLQGLGKTLTNVADDLAKDYDGYYLLSYCSPAREGLQTLVVEVNQKGSKGESLSGSTEVDFRADGFTSGCSSQAIPKFSGSAESERQAKSKSKKSKRKASTSSASRAKKTKTTAPASETDNETPEQSESEDEVPEDPQPIANASDSPEETIVPPPARPDYAQ